MYNRVIDCVKQIKKLTDFKPYIAIVLGSGLGDFADEIKVESTIDYSCINGFPVSTVEGHKGRFIFGYIEDIPVVLMQGRVHYYEGYTMQEVVLPIRVMALLGAEKLILTNAAGGVNESFKPGDLMMLKDQISSFVPSPLIGKNIDELGPRFPDMSSIYSLRMQDIIVKSADECNIDLMSGVYAQLTGPNYETPAEIKMFRILGADAVGMSTACEAIAAVHSGLEVCGISCITNMASGISGKPLNHEDVQKTADDISDKFQRLIKTIVIRLGENNV